MEANNYKHKCWFMCPCCTLSRSNLTFHHQIVVYIVLLRISGATGLNLSHKIRQTRFVPPLGTIPLYPPIHLPHLLPPTTGSDIQVIPSIQTFLNIEMPTIATNTLPSHQPLLLPLPHTSLSTAMKPLQLLPTMFPTSPRIPRLTIMSSKGSLFSFITALSLTSDLRISRPIRSNMMAVSIQRASICSRRSRCVSLLGVPPDLHVREGRLIEVGRRCTVLETST